MAIEIVDFPIKKWWFSMVMLVYQRLLPMDVMTNRYSELEAMAHRNRWFTELKDGDFPKNDGVCQLGWWMKFPTEWKVIKGIKAMFQTTNQPLPSGKHTKNYRKSPCSMGKSTVSMAIFNSKLLVYQRVIVTTKSGGPLCDHLPSGYFT